jgi:hypothetical protein
MQALHLNEYTHTCARAHTHTHKHIYFYFSPPPHTKALAALPTLVHLNVVGNSYLDHSLPPGLLLKPLGELKVYLCVCVCM